MISLINMSIKLKGDNTFTTSSTGLVWDTTVAGKSIDLRTNGDSRLLITDAGFAFTQPISTTTVVGGHLLINTDTASYTMVSTTPTNIRIWGSTENFVATLPNALSTALGTIYTIYNTSTVQIEVWTYSAGKHVDIESDYSATFVLIDDDFDAVASWKITSQGVPPYADAGTVLTSNGLGALPTYKTISDSSSGAWTPQLGYWETSLDIWSFVTEDLSSTGTYAKIRISSTVSLVTIALVITVADYGVMGDVNTRYLIIPNLPFKCTARTGCILTVRDYAQPLAENTEPISVTWSMLMRLAGDTVGLPFFYTATGYELLGYGGGIASVDPNNAFGTHWERSEGDCWILNYSYMTDE